MKPYLLILATVMPAFAQVQSSSTPDASKLEASEIAKKWSEPPASTSPTSRFTTRGVQNEGAKMPLATRWAGMSRKAAEANADTLRKLEVRGIKKLTGQRAADAQRAQDEALHNNGQSEARSRLVSDPEVIIELPVDESRQIAFRIRFKLDSTELADPESDALIDKAAEAMKMNPKLVFLLEGHTCDLGTSQHNQKLSEDRALRVRQLLMDRTVPANRILAVGKGESHPLVTNKNETARSENRRVMIGPLEVTLE